MECWYCGGRGKIAEWSKVDKTCLKCNGTGVLDDKS